MEAVKKNRPSWLEEEKEIPEGLSYRIPRPQNPHGEWVVRWPSAPSTPSRCLPAPEGSFPDALRELVLAKGGETTPDAAPPATLDYSDIERDDEQDIGPRAHERGPAVTTGRHRTEASSVDREPGDEIVTSTDKVSKLVWDCWKVERRGYGRVILKGRRLSDRLRKDIEAKFPTVVLKEDA
jgi:hypothetical protein